MEPVIFVDRRPISYHPKEVDLARAREDRHYAALFRRDYKTAGGTLQQVARMLTQAAWSPICWAHGRCLATEFVSSEWMALDFDTPAYTLAQCLQEWCDTVHIIGVTKSHQKEKGGITCDRFRLVVPWEDPVMDLQTYVFNMAELVDRYGADKACKDGARFFWPCAEVISVNLEGYLQPVKPAPPQKPWTPRAATPGRLPARTAMMLLSGVAHGGRNKASFGIAKDMLRNGIDPEQVVDTIALKIYKSPSPDELLEIRRTVQSALSNLAKETK